MKKEVKKEEVLPVENGGDTPEYCGGKVKPADIKGQAGSWSCNGGEWVWIPDVG